MLTQNTPKSESQKYSWHSFILFNKHNKTLDSNLYILYLLKKYKANNKSFILDWGCGFGLLIDDIYHRFYCKCTGLNISHKQIKIAKSLFEKKNKIFFHTTNGFSIHSNNSYYDFIVSQEALCYSPSKFQIFKEFYRVLKPNGIFIFHDWFKNHKYLSKYANTVYKTNVKSFNYYKKALLKSGFKNIQIHMPYNPECCGSKEIGCISFIVIAFK